MTTYSRTYTTWHSREGGRVVWITGDEGTGARLVRYQGTTHGTHKWDRLPMGDAPPAAQAAARCVSGDRCDWHQGE